jgi:hypothetical protein
MSTSPVYTPVLISSPEEALGSKKADFDAMYALYKSCFALPDEVQSKEEFIELLEKNASAHNAQEAWLGLKDAKGNIVAAWNYDVFAGSKTQGWDGTIHDIFTAVAPAHRQAGVFKDAMEARMKAAQAFVGNPEAKLKPFAEQNNPLLMTANEYIDDTKGAIDQCLRRNIFEKLNYRTLNMRYLQPPISETTGTNTYLDMVAQGEEDVPSSLIKEHLERFFELSFPQGTTLDHPELAPMKQDLEKSETITTAPEGRFKKLMPHLNLETLEALDETRKDTVLGKVFPALANQHFGKENLAKHGLGAEAPGVLASKALTPRAVNQLGS